MLKLRKSTDRGRTLFDWLDSYHTFSFREYRDPDFDGFRTLRIINEDWIKGGNGFPMHAHRNMEILTLVLEGRLEHKDSLGNHSVIQPNELQVMSAGTGIRHSEYNSSSTDPVHLLQIWMTPSHRGLSPTYQQQMFSSPQPGEWQLLANSTSSKKTIQIHQEAAVLRGIVSNQFPLKIKTTRHFQWIQIIRGKAEVNDLAVSAGDGIAAENKSSLEITSPDHAEVLLFEMS